MYECIFIFMCIYTYVCVCVYVFIYIYICVCVFVIISHDSLHDTLHHVAQSSGRSRHEVKLLLESRANPYAVDSNGPLAKRSCWGPKR